MESNNISAAQIANDYQQRVREAERQAELERANSRNDEEEYEESVSETPEERKKRKRKEAATLNKIKQSKAFARRKSRYGDDDPDYDDELARDMMYQKSRPLPGQFDNCENCSKRFTVTAYSKTGPNGGLLCAKCSKELADEEKKTIPKKRGPKNSRRQNRSNLLDGIVQTGALSLAEMCTKVRRRRLCVQLRPCPNSRAESCRQYKRCGRVWGSSPSAPSSAQSNLIKKESSHSQDAQSFLTS